MKANQLYLSLNDFLKERFGSKIIKLSIDGGFTCPNRDGTIHKDGCIFCSESGSGDFAGSREVSITEQMDEQIKLLEGKWPNSKYIAYFQNFTNTYDSVENLRKKYDEALSYPDVVGIAIATRPDCLSKEILNLLQEYNSKTLLWVELGLQSIHEKSALFVRRGYTLSVFDLAMSELNHRKIKTVSHLIINLPNESYEDIKQSLTYVCDKGVWGVKLQMLNILKYTDLEKHYLSKPFYLSTADEYIEIVSNLITIMPPDIVLHRLTGDGSKDILVAPKWVLNKRYVLNGIHKYMKNNNLYQSKNFLDIS